MVHNLLTSSKTYAALLALGACGLFLTAFWPLGFPAAWLAWGAWTWRET